MTDTEQPPLPQPVMSVDVDKVISNTTCYVLLDLAMEVLHEMSSTVIPTVNTNPDEIEEVFIQKFKQTLIPTTVQG